jgi:hypothetical protein
MQHFIAITTFPNIKPNWYVRGIRKQKHFRATTSVPEKMVVHKVSPEDQLLDLLLTGWQSNNAVSY